MIGDNSNAVVVVCTQVRSLELLTDDQVTSQWFN